MKKTLAAVAVLGAFAGSAVAADVTLYGLVDYSLNYQHLDSDVPTQDATDSTQLRSGANSGSRFGLKGTEDLGNGVKVGFVLENGFAADTGALGDKNNRLFDRESQLFVEGSFGRVAFGRFGQLASSLGSYGLLGVTGPFSTGWGDATGGLKFVSANGFGRYDNAVTYVTPSFGGLTVYAQYTTKKDDKAAGVENESSADRAYGIGAKFVGAGLTLVGVVDSTNYATWPSAAANQAMDDGLTVTIGGNYDFQVAKVYFGGQYFKNAKRWGRSMPVLVSSKTAMTLPPTMVLMASVSASVSVFPPSVVRLPPTSATWTLTPLTMMPPATMPALSVTQLLLATATASASVPACIPPSAIPRIKWNARPCRMLNPLLLNSCSA